MQLKRIATGLMAGALVFGGVACSEDNDTSESEDLSPELDGGEGEEGVDLVPEEGVEEQISPELDDGEVDE